MIGQFIKLYKARKDMALAKSIASEMLVDGAIGRISWPIGIAKFWMSVGIAGCAVIILSFLSLAAFTHWGFAVPALPFCAAIYGIVRLWRGINAGLEHVSRIAKTELVNRTGGSTATKTTEE